MNPYLRVLIPLTLTVGLLITPQNFGLRATALGQAAPIVRVAAPPVEDIAPILYAQHANLFAKAGVSVELQQLGNGAAISAAVAGGTIDIGFSSLPTLIAAHARGVPFELVVPGGSYTTDDPYSLMIVRKDSPIRGARDLAGKTIGLPTLRGMDWLASTAWLAQNGGDPKTAQFIELPNSELLQALVDGRVDAFTLGQPWVTRAIDSGKVRVFAKAYDAIALHFLDSAWFSTSATIDANRVGLQRFERAMAEASIYLSKHRSEVVPLLAAFTKLDPHLVARTLKGNELPYLDANALQPVIDASAKYHIIDKSFRASEMISPVALKGVE